MPRVFARPSRVAAGGARTRCTSPRAAVRPPCARSGRRRANGRPGSRSLRPAAPAPTPAGRDARFGHEQRELHAATGLVLERGALGVWLLVRPGATDRRLLLRARPRRAHAAERPRAPICCSRCAPTSAHSRPSPTALSPGRAGGCGGGSQSRCERRSTAPGPLRGPVQRVGTKAANCVPAGDTREAPPGASCSS